MGVGKNDADVALVMLQKYRQVTYEVKVEDVANVEGMEVNYLGWGGETTTEKAPSVLEATLMTKVGMAMVEEINKLLGAR